MVKEIVEEEELLNLSLSIVTDSGGRDRKRKRKIRALFDAALISNNYHGCDEAKIFRLLQMREQMLKPDNKRKGIVEDHGKGLHLIHLLLITATAVDDNNVSTALQNLSELYQTVALTGDSVQRVVAYFSDGLSAKLLTRKSPFHDMLIQLPTNEEEFLAFTYLYRVSPYYQFAHFTANQAILEAFEREEDSNNRALHVIDFDASYGFQWPSLIQSLSDKASSGHKISLRITGFGTCLEQLKETETRLVSFAKGFTNLVFEFHGSLRSSSSASSMVMMKKKKNETVAVNLVFHLNTLNDHFFKVSDTLKSIHDSISPAIVVLVEQEGSRNPRSFLSRFMESLHYFAAMFDSLDDCLPLESAERLSIEKNHLGKEIKSMLNYEIRDNYINNYNDDYEDNNNNKETWKGMKMERHGFRGMKMSSKCLIQAKLLLKIRSSHQSPIQFDGGENSSSNSGFRVFEKDEGKAICLGWQDRSLLTATAWHCI